MNPALWPYLTLTTLGYGLVYPVVALLRRGGRDRRRIGQRLGLYRLEPKDKGAKRLWMQAVSVGEVHLAAGLLGELKQRRPELDLVLSTTTTTGLAEARRLVKGTAAVIPFPLDTWPGAGRAVRALDPDLFVLVETELWPLILKRVLDFGTRVVMVNGRISDRTAKGYGYLAPAFRPLLSRFHGAGAVGEPDAARLINLGVPKDRLTVTGNAKQDSLALRADRDQVRDLGRRLGLSGKPVWVAGSIRSGEEKIIVEAFKLVREKVGEAILVAAPRHPERVSVLAETLESAGLEFHYRSQMNGSRPEPKPVIILDTMGELFSVYGSAKVALVGGGLAPHGGQNPLEPAYWKKPVLMGPHMDHFAEASRALLSAGGAVEVRGTRELAGQVIAHLTDRALREKTGGAAGAVCRKKSGAFERSVDLILDALDLKG